MIIGGLQKFSLLDYPGALAAIVFTQGCNFRCHFCYNPMLVEAARSEKFKDNFSQGKPKKVHTLIKEQDLFGFLEKRQGKLDAVVITGGEPTLHSDLPGFMARIKKMGFKVKLDTNGANPEMLQKLIKKGLVDYLAMDIKGPLDKYEKIVGTKADLGKIKKSIIIIKKSALPHEFRTTVAPGLINAEDIGKIGKMIISADKWFLQQFKADTDLVNPQYEKIKPYSMKALEKMKETAKKYVDKCEIR